MYSDVEFDIVNNEQLDPCKNLLDKLMPLQAVWKIHATGKNTYDNLNNFFENKDKSCDVVCEYSEEDGDLYSDEEFDIVNIKKFQQCKNSIGKLNNNNLELVARSNSSNRSWKVDENIFKNVEIDTNQWSPTDANFQSNNHNEDHSTTYEPNDYDITEFNDPYVDNEENGPSTRMKRRKNVLVNLQKHLENDSNRGASNSVPRWLLGTEILKTN